MKDQMDLLERIYRLHWRLRLRNPATEFEKDEWAEVRSELRDLFDPQPVSIDALQRRKPWLKRLLSRP